MGRAYVACGEEFFRVGFALVACTTEGFGHGQIDLEVFAVDVAGWLNVSFLVNWIRNAIGIARLASYVPGSCSDHFGMC